MKNIGILAILSLSTCLFCAPKPAVENMLCEWVDTPLAVDTQSPRFNWTYTRAAGVGFVEYGRKVEISTDADSLKNAPVTTLEATAPVLEPFTRYYWRATAWNKDESEVICSPLAVFETGPMCEGDWSAKWISDGLDKDTDASPMLRKEFFVGDNVESARLYMSAAAYAEVRINGMKASQNCLEPGYTAYDKRNLFIAYDVTDRIRPGANAVTAVLGNGFYNIIRPIGTWNFHEAAWRGRPRMIAEMHIKYADGSSLVVLTDESWKTTCDGPFLSNNLYSGDIYDARKEIPGWNEAGFDDSRFSSAIVVDAPGEIMQAQLMPGIAPVERIKPVEMKKFDDCTYVFNFGRNIAGVCEISLSGDEGTKVCLTHGELRKQDGSLEMRNIACYHIGQPDYEFQQDIYYMKGGAKEVWSPSFVYHGFQFVEVKTDKPVDLNLDSIEALYIHSAVADKGHFECSDPLLNTIWEMARRTYLNNLHSIFTDCPHREKNGWTADNFLTTELGLLNNDVVPYFNKWAYDVVDNIRPDGRISGIIPDWGWGYQDWIGPVWDSSIFTIAEYLYDFTGDATHIRTLWPVYKQYLEYLASREEEDGLPTYGIGDWVFLNVATPTQFTTPCFYYKDYCVMARFAEFMGEDPSPYKEKAESIRNAIIAKWWHSETNLFANGSQAAQGVALYMGVVPEGCEQAVADNLAASIEQNNGFLEFGSMGSKTVPRMLTKYGHVDTAYGLTTKEECPSWGGWAKLGFSTLCETWILRDDFRDASADHAFLGDIAAWYVSDLAGINYDRQNPGFRNILIRPHFPAGLDHAEASYDSVRGRISSSWKRSGNKITLSVSIPVGCTAEIVVGKDTIRTGAGKFRETFRL